MKGQFIQKWQNLVRESSKLSLYCQIKNNYDFEYYLDILKLNKFRNAYASLRLSCHDLEIERGRYAGQTRESRVCKLCKKLVEDEYHFVLICQTYNEIRISYIPQKYYRNPNVHKFIMLMSTTNAKLIQDLALYIYYAFEKRKLKLQLLNS